MGYAGGAKQDPTYHDLGDHSETIEIDYDPTKISYEQLLEVFWQAHDPTTLNQQGADKGTQYRSIILYHNEPQKLAAEKSKAEAQKNFTRPVVTEIVPFMKFYKAEDYHQGYYDANSSQSYCRLVIAPKLEKLEHKKIIQPAPQTPKP